MVFRKRAATERGLRFIIAGGGTGGHLFPGIAVAQEMLSRWGDAEVLFVVGRRKMEADILGRHGYPTVSIDVEGLKGKGLTRGLWTLFRMPRSLFQSVAALNGFSPDVVLGVGGYASGPFCAAAWLMDVPTAIHEQNAYPGLTNRLLGRIVDRVFISFEESLVHFPKKKVFVTGNPVRQNLCAVEASRTRTPESFTILVLGGSQGARAVNEGFVSALSHLNRAGRFPHVIHQTGESDRERVQEAYEKRGLRGEVAGFIQDMAGAYGRADLVVSRAGASTVFELAATGRPSILIPYPHAANQHQEVNAMALVRAGAAEILRQDDLTGEGLAELLKRYMDRPELLTSMGEKARGIARIRAAEEIVDRLTEMVGT